MSKFTEEENRKVIERFQKEIHKVDYNNTGFVQLYIDQILLDGYFTHEQLRMIADIAYEMQESLIY